MAGRGSTTFQKRQKELARKERQEEKRARRLQRKQASPGAADALAEESPSVESEDDESQSPVPVIPTIE